MNENIDLTNILKDCPKGWKFYSSIYDDVEFLTVQTECTDIVDEFGNVFDSKLSTEEVTYPIRFTSHGDEHGVSSSGKHIKGKGECTFFPSREQRDWSKFTAPWYKKDKFDPKTLQPFDKVLVKISNDDVWTADFFSHYDPLEKYTKYVCVTNLAVFCIPYNDDTKHLVGTTDEAPEYYRYWED